MMRMTANGRTASSNRMAAGSRSSATGRGAVFSVKDIAGLKLWLRAETLNLSPGAAVASWNDDSGQNNYATQSVGALRPSYVTNVLNGKPGVRFNNLQHHWLILSYNITGSVGTIFAVIANVALLQVHHGLIVLDKLSLYTELDFSGWGTHTSEAGVYYGDIAPSPGLMTVLVRSSDDIDLLQNGGGLQNHIEGLGFPSRGMSTISVDPVYDQSFGGDLLEAIVFDVPLSTADRVTVEQYLMKKYKL